MIQTSIIKFFPELENFSKFFKTKCCFCESYNAKSNLCKKRGIFILFNFRDCEYYKKKVIS